jgi:CDP-glycerol glycerophosphotransferase (TagB/SpsB family)
MPTRISLRLTKAIRKNIEKNFHLLPHEVLGIEQRSLSDRLKDQTDLRTKLFNEMEATNDRQQFTYLLKVELPRIDKLIERMTNEIKRLNHDISYELNLHLHQQDPTVYRHPSDYPSRELP